METQTQLFATPVEKRYFEDYTIGSVHFFGPTVVKQDDIIAFARHFDPQPFHLDREAAERSIYGGLIASGWHTASLASRLFVDHYLSRAASLGSPGVEELRWLQPVRPGDRLFIRVSVLKVRPSKSKPDRGIIYSLLEVINQEDEVVTDMKLVNFLLRRSKEGGV